MPVMVTAGQVLLKKNSAKVITGKGVLRFIRSCLEPGIIIAAVCTAGAPLLYIAALGTVPLSEAFAFNSLNYILVFLTARFLLKERVNMFQIIGVVFITAGFLLPILVSAGA
jgi:drug/metabolite transporter (DMT)-like permease